jgi:hypothetical protein
MNATFRAGELVVYTASNNCTEDFISPRFRVMQLIHSKAFSMPMVKYQLSA